MATATKTRRPAKKAPAKKAPTKKVEPIEEEELEEELEDEVEADEVDEDEDEELEELEEDEVEEAAPKSKRGGAAQEVEFGVSDLVAYLNKKYPVAKGKKPLDARGLRTLIRRMARDETGRVDREIVAGNRTRYDWKGGLAHPEVKAIIKAYRGGELEQDKQEKLEALKARGEEKRAEKAKAATKTTAKKAGKKAKPAPVVEEDDDEELELDDDE